MKIDVTTTAMPRHELLERTYQSFESNLRGFEFNRLWLNMDRFPSVKDSEHRAEVIKCLDVASKFFPHVVARDSHCGNFARAVKWAWGNADTDYILNLEDDWELMFPIDLGDVLKMFAADTVQVSFRAYRRREVQHFMLGPSLIRKDCYQEIAKRMPETMNPEVWIRLQARKWTEVATYPHQPQDKIVVRDLGREWLQESRWRRCNRFEDRFISYADRTEETEKIGVWTPQAAQAEISRQKYFPITS